MVKHLVTYAEQSAPSVTSVCGLMLSTWDDPVRYVFEAATTTCPACLRLMDPDFDQIALRLVEAVLYRPLPEIRLPQAQRRARAQVIVAEQLRQAWIAGAADYMAERLKRVAAEARCAELEAERRRTAHVEIRSSGELEDSRADDPHVKGEDRTGRRT